jgi:hypothetical protein
MTANINSETGIPYGVIYANDVPYLFDDITTHGDDLTYQGFKDQLKDQVKAALVSAIDDYTYRAEKVVERLDLGEIVGGLLDAGLNDDYQAEETEYSYEYECDTTNGKGKGKVKLLVGWLGGSPLIWVLESPYVVGCRQCSPCVPNAGDLNSPDEGGSDAYCLPPDDLPEDWDGPKPRLLPSLYAGPLKPDGEQEGPRNEEVS